MIAPLWMPDPGFPPLGAVCYRVVGGRCLLVGTLGDLRDMARHGYVVERDGIWTATPDGRAKEAP